ncbi:hypothetical protein SY83_03705 [Paenibacillus swuensis]|uniref:Zinc-finger domain-containing protein n=1 Tax=Paenibacillus swuensis TaxID=1178515 RepID=A0A172TET0_9BACL|nr:hypothetical protein [Paenibacillus swuensis]ANE45558.1 hypothetical protein SY83_03705 [Paenibacillus swuensis]
MTEEARVPKKGVDVEGTEAAKAGAHYTESAWRQYAIGSLTDAEQLRMEDHLYDCEQCLGVYMVAMEAGAGDIQLDASDMHPDPGDMQVNTGDVQANTADMQPVGQHADAVSAAFTDQVMLRLAAIETESAPVALTAMPKPDAYKVVRRRTWFHYAVAAAITLLLMSSGVFQSLLTQSTQLSTNLNGEGYRSISDQIMNRTGSVLDELPAQGWIKGDRR